MVAHDLELELVPADHGLLEQDLRDRAELQPLLADAHEALVVVGDAAADAAQRVGGADDEREAELRAGGLGLVHGLGQHAARRAQADLVHGRAELEAVLGAVDGLLVGADHLDLPEVEHAGALELHGQVERRLPAERGQQGVRALYLDDARERGQVERLDVRPRREGGVGHDRRRVTVDEHDLVALVEEDLAGLRAGVVELAGLPDDDGPRADDEDLVEVVAARHQASRPRSNRSISLAEPLEEVQGVVRSRRRFRVVLDGEGEALGRRHALDRAVVEVHVRDLGPGDGLVAHGEPVVLRRDLDHPGAQVLDRVVGAAVAELELEGLHAERLRQKLVPEADAEHGHLAEQALDGLDGVRRPPPDRRGRC